MPDLRVVGVSIGRTLHCLDPGELRDDGRHLGVEDGFTRVCGRAARPHAASQRCVVLRETAVLLSPQAPLDGSNLEGAQPEGFAEPHAEVADLRALIVLFGCRHQVLWGQDPQEGGELVRTEVGEGQSGVQNAAGRQPGACCDPSLEVLLRPSIHDGVHGGGGRKPFLVEDPPMDGVGGGPEELAVPEEIRAR